ncbi:hypothetical protein AB0F72_14780 [Actinoplanes sp. NPDC023936]|uniref:hypothetical protein n=1 Tax=Actinoplanes sp. NPDC023936 TaxID=3154910 RepID=UPI0033BFFB6B
MSATQRRLLALYPRDFRRDYEEELLAVLAAEGRPGPGQVFDLVRSALVVRLRRVPVPAGLRQSARVVQLFGALLLLALEGRRVVPLVPGHLDVVAPVDYVRLAGWSLVLVAVAKGWRLLGFTGAAIGLAGEIAAALRWYLDTPAMLLNAYWIIMTAAVVLVAGLLATRAGRPRGLLLVLSAGGLLILVTEIDWLLPYQLSPLLVLGRGDVEMLLSDMPAMSGVAVLMLVAAAGLVLVAAIRQEATVRRWLPAWAAPVLVTVPLIRSGFDGFMEYNSYHPEATRLIGPVQWAALVLVPMAAFLVVAMLSGRYERSRQAKLPRS